MTPGADNDITEITADTAAGNFFASAEEFFFAFWQEQKMLILLEALL